MYLKPLFWCFICFYSCINVGRSIATQYSDPAGKLSLVKISGKVRSIFLLNKKSSCLVIKASVVTYTVGYLFSATEFICFVVTFCLKQNNKIQLLSNVIGFTYGAWLIILALFVGIKYSTNMHKAYDSDWITDIQRAFSVLPKRKCKIISQIDDSTYLVLLSGNVKRKVVAKSTCHLSINSKMLAVHSYEQGRPFWTIRCIEGTRGQGDGSMS